MHSPVILQLVGVRFCTRVEESCKLDSLLCNIFKVADDVLRLPTRPSANPVHEDKERRTLYMLVTYPMHDTAAFCLRGGTDSGSRHTGSTQRGASLLGVHATGNST